MMPGDHLRSLSELAKVDAITARFSPGGLLTANVMRPAASAEYVQQLVVLIELDERVPASIREAFERVRTVHIHGLFSYGLFTMASQAAWILPETALGARFLAWYEGRIPLVRASVTAFVEASAYDVIVEALMTRGSHPLRDGWRLAGHADYGEGRRFDGSYWSLLQWARQGGLLAPWLAKRWGANADGIRYSVVTSVRPPDYAVPEDWHGLDEPARDKWWLEWGERVWVRDEIENLVKLRNLAAHPQPQHTVTPVDSAHALRAVGAFIDAVWMEQRRSAPTAASSR
jgi:hypothetical protein